MDYLFARPVYYPAAVKPRNEQSGTRAVVQRIGLARPRLLRSPLPGGATTPRARKIILLGYIAVSA